MTVKCCYFWLSERNAVKECICSCYTIVIHYETLFHNLQRAQFLDLYIFDIINWTLMCWVQKNSYPWLEVCHDSEWRHLNCAFVYEWFVIQAARIWGKKQTNKQQQQQNKQKPNKCQFSGNSRISGFVCFCFTPNFQNLFIFGTLLVLFTQIYLLSQVFFFHFQDFSEAPTGISETKTS